MEEKIKADIRQLMIERKVTYQALADATGIGQSNLVKMLSDGRDIRLSNLCKICEALGLELGAHNKIDHYA